MNVQRSVVVMLGALLFACQHREAVLTVDIEPAILNAELTSRTGQYAGGAYRMSWRVVLREHAGADAEVHSIRYLARESRTMQVLVEQALDTQAIMSRAGSNRVPANGTLVVPLEAAFGYEPLRVAPAEMTTVVEAADVRGRSVQAITAITSMRMDE